MIFCTFRLYLINSPVVRGENLRFREEGVKDILKDVFLPWYNAYRFLVQNVQRYETEEKVKFRAKLVHSTNIMDRWIMSFTHSLVAYVHQEMAGRCDFLLNLSISLMLRYSHSLHAFF